MEIPNRTDSSYFEYIDYFDYIDVGETAYLKIYFPLQIIAFTWYSIIILLGLAGNGLVIWISGFRMKTISAVWFLNLAIADFISCIFLIFRLIQIILEIPSAAYVYLCTISLTALFTNMVTSVNFLILISLDRCSSIMWPFWTKIHRTKKLVWTLSGIMWLLNFIIFFLQLFVDFDFFIVAQCSVTYRSTNRIRYKDKEKVMVILWKVCVFAIPFLIIFISYGLIVLKLRTIRRRRSPRPFMIIAAILISFFICWFPYHTWAMISLRDEGWKTDLIVGEICTILAYFNSAINPVLYVFLSKRVKKNFVNSIPKAVENILSDPCDVNDRNEEDDINKRTDLLHTNV
ncbi:N-formyl peptide receptor 3-like [Anomaloglossus baeobatrachus]|uniref:N-formyl peptide receptor 3-like n=1 Tax=Anomaloglossus baeobatrachus TaxID=238106 RepID=UPI003F50207B